MFRLIAMVAILLGLAAPLGAQEVGQVSLHVVDPARADPVATGLERAWNVDIYYPAKPGAAGKAATYAPDSAFAKLLATDGYYDTPEAVLTSWATAPAPALRDIAPAERRLPLITLSPGLGVAAFNYSRLAAELARRGFAVAVIDHPYVGISRLPGGRVMKAGDYKLLANDNMAEWAPAIADWARDISVTLDRLAGPGRPAGLTVDLDRVVAVGHSLGGTIVLEACDREARLVACANFEGTPEGTVVSSKGPSKPVLFVGSRSGKPDRPHVAPPIDRPPYSDFAKGNGPATWLVAVRGGSHMSYSDAPFVMPSTISRFGGELMTPERSMQVYAGMTEAFARAYQGPAADEPAFRTMLEATPEVKFRRLRNGRE